MTLPMWTALIAALVLGILIGLVGSPWLEARNQRRLALKRLRENWKNSR